MTTEVWLALFSILSAGGTAVWVVLKVIIPKLVTARLEAARDLREHRQVLESTEARSVVAEREANQRLTMTLNQNIIGTLERSMAESTVANETIRERFFGRLDTGLNHIYAEMDAIRLEMRRMNANYSDLARDRHLLDMENYSRLERKIEWLGELVNRLAVVVQATSGIEVRSPEEIDGQSKDHIA